LPENGSQREMGARFQEVSELRHDLRNLKQSLILLDSEQRSQERRLMELKSEIIQIKTKIMTLAAVVIAFLSISAWVLEWFFK
jgi:chromosome segregation ATPase